MTSFVAYYRVSTERQGKSGLGLAAQRRKIAEFLTPTDQLIGEFCDIESGRQCPRIRGLDEEVGVGPVVAANRNGKLSGYVERRGHVLEIVEGLEIDLIAGAEIDSRPNSVLARLQMIIRAR